MNLTSLDFVVVNTRTGNPCASFMIPRDALHYIKWRRESEGPNGPTYEIVNSDGTMVSTTLSKQVAAVNDSAAREHTRLNPNWS